jgi:hypothetical protein
VCKGIFTPKLRRVETLSVDPNRLSDLADSCESAAAELAASALPRGGASSHQATSAAVAAAHSAVIAASAVFAHRMRTTGDKLATAGASFVAQEECSAQQIAAVTITGEV